MNTNDALGKIGVALVGALLFIIVGAWWVTEAGDVVLEALNAGLKAAIVLAVIGSIVGLLFASWCALQRGIKDRAEVRKALAEARRAERDAQHTVIVANSDQQVYITDDNHSVEWRAAHRDPRVYANGQWSEPRSLEIAAYVAYLESIQPRIEGRVVDNLLAAPSPVYLMSELANIERALIVGGSGSGKTTLLQHVISGRKGDVVVIDPHDDTNTWPGNAQVIGGGQDYDEIERALVALVGQVRERYQVRSVGQVEEFDPLTVIVDEWREIVKNTKTAADNIKTVLTGGRKVGTCCIVASHSDRARPLGIEGESDLRDGFVLVHLRGNSQVGFSATLDTGDGEQPVILPGPYTPGVAAPERPALINTARVRLPMSGQEQEILRLHQAGHSVSRIGKEVYGSRGGWQSDRVREVLQKFKKA